MILSSKNDSLVKLEYIYRYIYIYIEYIRIYIFKKELRIHN